MMTTTKVNPPLLTGGSLQSPCAPFPGVLIDAHIDFLTVSVSPAAASFLMLEENTQLYEAGYARHGFKSSEQRLCVGGRCWRRFHPVQQDNQLIRDWGSFESWEFDGNQADLYFSRLASFACRPSRIDISFDYDVPEDYIANRFIDEYRPIIVANGLSIGISGGEVNNTRYIGSGVSERRIRAYRKDWQSVTYKQYGSILRVELVLRKHQARAFWEYFVKNGKQACLRLAASNIFDMCGFVAVPEDLPEIPIIEKPPANDSITRIYHFFRQYGGILAVLYNLRLNIRALAGFQVCNLSRMAKHRCDCVQSELSVLSPDEIEEQLCDLLSINRLKALN